MDVLEFMSIDQPAKRKQTDTYTGTHTDATENIASSANEGGNKGEMT